jgi:cbb3-type cytochrome oxidase subunit 3
MTVRAWIYFGFTALLTAVLAGIVVYLFRSKRKEKGEAPKYRMLEDDD